MISSLFEKIQRRGQLSFLKKHPNVSFTTLKIGVNNHFNIRPTAKKVNIGKNVSLRNYVHLLVEKNAELFIEDNCFMNNFCSINCLEKITIGENTLFGEGVKLYDHNHEYTREEPFKIEHQIFKSSPISIGKNCWLGSNVTILKGVSIGDNCIIGAGCVIYKDIPENSIVTQGNGLLIKNR